VSAGAPQTLGHAAFACSHQATLDDLHTRASDQSLAPVPFHSPLLRPGAFAVRDPDGHEVIVGLSADVRPAQGLRGPLQHLTFATRDVSALERFYADGLGFAVSDRVRRDTGEITTSFMRSNHEHHTIACFEAARTGIDHHSYETGEWAGIREWADRFAARSLPLMWGPGRHGPGNNLFIFIEDPDGNWIEVSAELEVIHDRPLKEWPHEERTLNLWGRAIMRS
jgi:catechol 2,3-dioxygenase-like lactoylglutathione lyase family enzyme